MRAAAWGRKHEREEEALRDLDPLLVGERAGAFGRDLRAGRHEAGEALGRRVDELLVPDRSAQTVGQQGVDRLDVTAKELRSLGVERGGESGRCLRLGLVPVAARGKAAEQLLAAHEMCAGRGARGVEGGRRVGRARAPGVDLCRREARCLEERVRLRHLRAGTPRRARRS